MGASDRAANACHDDTSSSSSSSLTHGDPSPRLPQQLHTKPSGKSRRLAAVLMRPWQRSSWSSHPSSSGSRSPVWPSRATPERVSLDTEPLSPAQRSSPGARRTHPRLLRSPPQQLQMKFSGTARRLPCSPWGRGIARRGLQTPRGRTPPHRRVASAPWRAHRRRHRRPRPLMPPRPPRRWRGSESGVVSRGAAQTCDRSRLHAQLIAHAHTAAVPFRVGRRRCGAWLCAARLLRDSHSTRRRRRGPLGACTFHPSLRVAPRRSGARLWRRGMKRPPYSARTAALLWLQDRDGF